MRNILVVNILLSIIFINFSSRAVETISVAGINTSDGFAETVFNRANPQVNTLSDKLKVHLGGVSPYDSNLDEARRLYKNPIIKKYMDNAIFESFAVLESGDDTKIIENNDRLRKVVTVFIAYDNQCQEKMIQGLIEQGVDENLLEKVQDSLRYFYDHKDEIEKSGYFEDLNSKFGKLLKEEGDTTEALNEMSYFADAIEGYKTAEADLDVSEEVEIAEKELELGAGDIEPGLEPELDSGSNSDIELDLDLDLDLELDSNLGSDLDLEDNLSEDSNMISDNEIDNFTTKEKRGKKHSKRSSKVKSKDIKFFVEFLNRTKSKSSKDKIKSKLNEKIKKIVKNKKNKDKLEVQEEDGLSADDFVKVSDAVSSSVSPRIMMKMGVSSGDIGNTYGLWTKGILSKGNQTAYDDVKGYKFDQKGGAIGFDIGDDSMVGVAYSFLEKDVTGKINSSNRDKIMSHIGVVYGRCMFTDKVFAAGQAQFIRSNIKKERASGIDDAIAKGKTNATTISVKLKSGYDYTINSAMRIVPSIGVGHIHTNVDAYKDEGGLGREIGKRMLSKTSALADLSAKCVIGSGNIQVIPEIHAGVDYAFTVKNSDTVITILKV